MWLSQKKLNSLQKYRSSGSESEDPVESQPNSNFTTPVRRPRTPETPRRPVRREILGTDSAERTREYPGDLTGAPSATEVFDEISAASQHEATGTSHVSELYSGFMRNLYNTNFNLLNSFEKIYSKMRCQLTDCMLLNSISVSNTLRQDGKFLMPKGVKVDDSSQKYVAIVTLKKVNQGSVNEDYLTQDVTIVKGDDNIPISSINNKSWIQFVKKNNIITVPWCPTSVPIDVNDWENYVTETNSNSCIRITINTDEYGITCAYLGSFMYEHMHCKTTLKNAKHIMDVIKSFLYNCSEDIKYMYLTDATYDISEKSGRKHVYDSIISKKVRTLLTKKSTVYTNYGLLPYQNSLIQISFGVGVLPHFILPFIEDTKKIIKKYDEKIKILSEQPIPIELKEWFVKETKLLGEKLFEFENSNNYFENENNRVVNLELKIFWENDECWIQPIIRKHNDDGTTKSMQIQKGRYIDMFKLIFEPMINNIATQPSLWYDEVKEFITHEKNVRRLATVKDVIETAIKEFKSYDPMSI